MAFAHPSQGERYLPRLLITSFAAFISFEDVRTVDGHMYTIFRAACNGRELITDDLQYDRTLE